MNNTTSVLLALVLNSRCLRRPITFRNLLSIQFHRLEDQIVRLVALQPPSISAFATFFGSGSDLALVNITGLARRAFWYLLYRFDHLNRIFTAYQHCG